MPQARAASRAPAWVVTGSPLSRSEHGVLVHPAPHKTYRHDQHAQKERNAPAKFTHLRSTREGAEQSRDRRTQQHAARHAGLLQAGKESTPPLGRPFINKGGGTAPSTARRKALQQRHKTSSQGAAAPIVARPGTRPMPAVPTAIKRMVRSSAAFRPARSPIRPIRISAQRADDKAQAERGKDRQQSRQRIPPRK